jgi:hypothetical protein
MNTTTADADLSVGRSFAVPRNARRWHLPKRRTADWQGILSIEPEERVTVELPCGLGLPMMVL